MTIVRPHRLSLTIGSLLALTGCATNPVTGEREFVMMSEAQEIAMGRKADVEVRREMGLYDDDALQRYVEEIGLELASHSHRPELPWSFAIVDSPAINAFALPGGFIYLTRGIMPYLSDEAGPRGCARARDRPRDGTSHRSRLHPRKRRAAGVAGRGHFLPGRSRGRWSGRVRAGGALSPLRARRRAAGRSARCRVCGDVRLGPDRRP